MAVATLAPRRARRIPLGDVAAPVVGVAVIVAIWIIGGKAEWGSGMVVTPAAALKPITGGSSDVYWRATTATVSAALRGLAIGSVLAFAAALIAATAPPLRRAITRLAAIANAAPWVAVAPVLLVVLGKDSGPVAVAAIAVFFYVFVSTTIGLGAAPAAAHDVLSSLGASRRLRVTAVQLPPCWPSVIDGLRLAAPAALAGAIFGEWYGAKRGLGVLLLTAMQSGRADRLWAASLISAGVGLLAFGLLAGLRWLLVRRYGAVITQTATRSATTRRTRNIVAEALTAVVLVAVLVLTWYAYIEIKNVSPLVVPRPSRVWRDFVDGPGQYVDGIEATLVTAGLAFLIGGVLAFAAALASSFKWFAGIAVPVVVVMAATPIVALFPLLARIFGYDPATVRLIAAVMVFFPIFVYTRSGLAATSRSAVDVVHALGASRLARFRRVTLPAAVPHVVSGARIAAGSAVIAAVVGESLIGRTGLGVQFSYSYRNLKMPHAFGIAIAIVVVSVVVFAVAGSIERAVHARWS